ncbi:MAG: FKBP-type peptidyl-prolyl cis-trans isomerase [Chitinophagaceae bacterium]
MKKTTVTLCAFAAVLLVACSGGGLKKTRSGLLYKIVSDGKGVKAKRGDILKLHVIQKVRDSLLGTSYDKVPFYVPVDSVGPVYDPSEIFPLLRKGDSAVTVLLADSIFKKSGQLPPFAKRKDKFTISFRVVDIFTSDSAARADREKAVNAYQEKLNKDAEAQKAPKVKEIEDYLAKNKITAQKAPQGTYIEVKDPGTGEQADTGKIVSVRYTGKLFPSGKVFETNMDKDVLQVPLGQHQVIAGWEEGLKYFKKGGKGTLYIPFFLAYDKQNGPGGSPFENLIFDIVVEDVKTAPATPAAPVMPVPQGQAPQH